MISACLLGVNCNYKGGCSYDFTKDSRFWSNLKTKFNIIPICPEQQGGLPTPRIPSELFVKGAEEILRIARLYSVQYAVLKSKSPSCGVKSVYDGTFKGVLIPGMGYTAYLLNKSNIRLFDEKDFCDFLKCTISNFKV